MRRYDIVFGTILILSILDFALAAPVLLQEKRQERVDAVHIPKDETTVLGKRFIEDLEKLWGVYSKTGGTSEIEPSSSALLEPDHGSMNVVQPQAPNPVSSTANPDTSKKSSSCWGNCFGVSWGDLWKSLESLRDEELRDDGLDDPLLSLLSPGSRLPSSSGSENGFTWYPPKQIINPILNPKLLISPEADPNFDWEHWLYAPDPPPRSPSPPKESAQANNPPSTSGHAPSPPLGEPDPEAATPSPPSSDLGSPKEPDYDVVSEPPQSPDPKLHLDDQSLGTGSQPIDFQAAIYAAKGKAKESRHISNAARDVGNAAQRELQPVERSLDPEDLTIRGLGNL